MNKKMIFRLLGALASALIVAGVFVPFVSVTGYSKSLWQLHADGSLYLPVMIIVFGLIGVILFAVNRKTEFAYSSTGAIIFFIIMYTLDNVNQDTFKTLGVGYYLLIIGAVLTGLMALLTSSKDKVVVTQAQTDLTNSQDMINKIDNLYDNQKLNEEVQPIQPVNNIVEPIPVPVNPISEIEDGRTDNLQDVPKSQPVNPVVQEFMEEKPKTFEPVREPVVNNQVGINPVVQEFMEEKPKAPVINNQVNTNPAIQGFINEQPKAPVVSNPEPNPNQTDIFGQPINREGK